jgi:hypothetical protein
MLRKAWVVSNEFGGIASQKGHPGQAELSFGSAAIVRRRRGSKRVLIAKYFAANLEVPISSALLHAHFGSAVRTRISEINRDQDAAITIRNTTTPQADGSEHSTYTAVRR